MITYIIQSTVCLGISYLLYQLFLRKEKTFIFNRFYLLGTIFLSLLVPTFEIETSLVSPVISEMKITNIFTVSIPIAERVEGMTIENMKKEIDFIPQILYLYLLITTFLALRFSKNLLRIKQLINKRGPKIDGLQVILVDKETNPFSFFNFLFINKEEFKCKKLTQSLLMHEHTHSKQLHSIDIILVEILTCFFWFNPFIWLYKRAISENHEYLADYSVMKEGIDLGDYLKKIIQSVNKLYPLNMASGFSYVQTKNRLIMLNKAKSSISVRTIKLIGILILLGTSLILSSLSGKSDKNQFVVVVDAGHGGKDNGVVFDGAYEKELSLNISKTLEALSDDNEVKIVLTRETDQYIKLEDRVQYAKDKKADMFLSIHLTISNDLGNKGVEAFYFGQGKFQKQSHIYSKILVSEQLKSICDKGEIKTASYIVLKNDSCPAVLLELGFLSNEIDRKRLEDPDHQYKIAASIYNGLIKIKEQSH